MINIYKFTDIQSLIEYSNSNSLELELEIVYLT